MQTPCISFLASDLMALHVLPYTTNPHIAKPALTTAEDKMNRVALCSTRKPVEVKAKSYRSARS